MNYSLRWFHLKNSLIEWFKYDSKFLSLFYSFFLFCFAALFFLLNKPVKAFSLIASLFRTNWFGSYQLSLLFIKCFIGRNINNPKFKIICAEYINRLEKDPNKEHIHKNPERLFEYMLIVVKSPKGNKKGVAILKYSYYFPLFLKLFNVEEFIQKYHLVLEPSWAGFLDLSILSYTQFNEPVYVMTYEEKDRRLLKELDSNLVSIDIGPNWWVDDDNFISPVSQRDIDVIVVASWSKFKRHYQVLQAIKKVTKTKKNIKVCFVGYGGDLGIDFVRQLICFFDLNENVTLIHKVPTEEVARLMARSKVNVLWSRFEGNNRSIIEGFFCDTPIILRKGHNFGDKYNYINEQTGIYSDESELSQNILDIVNQKLTFSPRSYVMESHNYKVAMNRIAELTGFNDSLGFSHKINLLKGMQYTPKNSKENFILDYSNISKLILQPTN